MALEITQFGSTIVSNQTEIHSQYSNNTVEATVYYTDDTFNDFDKYISIQIRNFTSATYTFALEEVTENHYRFAFPSETTYYGGTITVSLYGLNADGRILTTNKVSMNVVHSNPTGKEIEPIGTDWVEIMQDYVNTQVSSITPFIDTEQEYGTMKDQWFIGQNLPTGVRASGDRVTIGDNKNWYINGIDTGVPARATYDNPPIASSSILGTIKVGAGLQISEDGTLTPKLGDGVFIDTDGAIKSRYTMELSGESTLIITSR